jgi:hypothetical protein
LDNPQKSLRDGVMTNNSKNYLIELAEGVVDYFWNNSLPAEDIDHSARKGASNKIIMSIASKIGYLDREDAYKKIMTLIESDKEYRASLEYIINKSILNFENHYIKYGGKSALFAYCLLLSLGNDDNSKLFRAKACLLNWYAEERKLNRSMVDGGIVGAAWPFEWFGQNFDAIAASVVASGIFNTSIGIIKGVLKAFRASFEPIKKSCDPYPQPVLRMKASNQTIEDFENYLEEVGLIDQFLYIFKLNEDEISQFIEDWTEAFI